MKDRILIADDNRSITEILKMNFDLIGYEVDVAPDGLEAERSIARFRPDLVILDVMMPHKTGYQLCRELKNNPATARIPVILLTAKTNKKDIDWGMDSGADAYVCKPYDSKKLEELVARLIQEAREGIRSTSWTGLADASRLESEFRDAKTAGEAVLLLEASFVERDADVFRKKYGDATYKDLVRAAARILETTVGTMFPRCKTGQRPNDTFVFLVPSTDVFPVQEEVSHAVNIAVKAFYDRRDNEQGYILYRSPLSPEEERVPLLALAWSSV